MYNEYEELYHHGVEGQRWGKRNGPPYPLGLTRKEYKAKQRYDNHKSESSSKKEPESKSGLTDTQKKAIKIGAAVVAGSALIAGGVYLAKSGKFDSLVNSGKSFLVNKGITSDTGGAGITSSQIERFVSRINPNAGKFGYQNNCGNCAIAADLNARGIKCTASANLKGMTISQLGSCYDGLNSNSFVELKDSLLSVPDLTRSSTMSDIQNRGIAIQDKISEAIRQQYAGETYSRGALALPSTITGGHYVSWEKIGDDIKFYNTQNPGRDLTTTFFGTYTFPKSNSASTLMPTAIRLDNVTPVESVIKSVVDTTFHKNKNFDSFTELGKNFVMKK